MEKTSYEDYLTQNGSLTYTFRGVSMLPLLRQGKDLYTLKKKTGQRCKKYDVVLYRRKANEYVLHRVVQVREKDYVILGDNCINKEYGITDEDIVGVMTEYIRKGKIHSVEEASYRMYSVVWYQFYPLRCFLKKMKGKLARLCKHFLHFI